MVAILQFWNARRISLPLPYISSRFMKVNWERPTNKSIDGIKYRTLLLELDISQHCSSEHTLKMMLKLAHLTHISLTCTQFERGVWGSSKIGWLSVQVFSCCAQAHTAGVEFNCWVATVPVASENTTFNNGPLLGVTLHRLGFDHDDDGWWRLWCWRYSFDVAEDDDNEHDI